MFRPLVGCSSASLAEEEPFHKVSPPFLVELELTLHSRITNGLQLLLAKALESLGW
jgi:hypothetical protein